MTVSRLFVDVDTQHDFCDPKGALFVTGAPAIMPAVERLIEAAAARPEVLLVGSVDTHDFTAWEFSANGGPFPPHCVKGTPGWLKMPNTLPERAVFVPNESAEAGPIPEKAEAIYFEKEVYSLFVNPRAEAVLERELQNRGARPADVEAVVFGVATDYCIKAAALGLRERGYRVTVVGDAIAAVADETGRQAEAAMCAAGCAFASTDAVLATPQ